MQTNRVQDLNTHHESCLKQSEFSIGWLVMYLIWKHTCMKSFWKLKFHFVNVAISETSQPVQHPWTLKSPFMEHIIPGISYRQSSQKAILASSQLQWRHKECNGVPNHRRRHCLLNCWFQAPKENIKAPRAWPLRGEVTSELPEQRASNAEKSFHLVTSSWLRQCFQMTFPLHAIHMEPFKVKVIWILYVYYHAWANFQKLW